MLFIVALCPEILIYVPVSSDPAFSLSTLLTCSSHQNFPSSSAVDCWFSLGPWRGVQIYESPDVSLQTLIYAWSFLSSLRSLETKSRFYISFLFYPSYKVMTTGQPCYLKDGIVWWFWVTRRKALRLTFENITLTSIYILTYHVT